MIQDDQDVFRKNREVWRRTTSPRFLQSECSLDELRFSASRVLGLGQQRGHGGYVPVGASLQQYNPKIGVNEGICISGTVWTYFVLVLIPIGSTCRFVEFNTPVPVHFTRALTPGVNFGF